MIGLHTTTRVHSLTTAHLNQPLTGVLTLPGKTTYKCTHGVGGGECGVAVGVGAANQSKGSRFAVQLQGVSGNRLGLDVHTYHCCQNIFRHCLTSTLTPTTNIASGTIGAYDQCTPPGYTRTIQIKLSQTLQVHKSSGQGGRTRIADGILWQNRKQNNKG